jgi:adenine-specific DNA-methyltransferase
MGETMSTNISKQKRIDLSDKIKAIHKYIAASKQDENTRNFLTWLSEIQKEINGKKFGLVFEEHREGIDETLETHLPVLTENKKLFIDNDGEVNFIIEGDNLAALQLLLKTHKGRIDLIYIDPPYNTGNKDFLYDDVFVQKDDEFLHSKWLSFMNARLKLAKQLLSKNGCIFISINENEVFQLKILCDEIFGHYNYLTTFVVKVRHENRILKGDKDFHEVFEYLLFYRSSPDHKTKKILVDNTSNDEYVYKIIEKISTPQIITFSGKNVAVYKPGQYEIKLLSPDADNLKKISIRGAIKEGNSSGRFFMRHLNQYMGTNIGFLYKVPDMGDDGLGFRYFLIPDKITRKNGDYFQGVPVDRKETKEVPYANLLDFQSEFNNVGYEGEIEFRNGKKPVAFIKKCLEMGGIDSRKKIVLDFFAGSGTTGHAVLDMNKQDCGKRNFILCTNNENKICREVTYERIKRVIKKENYPASLKYFKIDYLSISDKLYYEYANELLKHIRELVELENGINFTNNDKIAIILTDEELDDFVKNIKKHKDCRKLYRAHDILVSGKHAEILKSSRIKVNVIPDYYYGDLEI